MSEHSLNDAYGYAGIISRALITVSVGGGVNEHTACIPMAMPKRSLGNTLRSGCLV